MSSSFHPPGAKPAVGAIGDNRLPSGIWLSEYPDGKPAAQMTYSDDGVCVGTARQFYHDGTPLLEIDFSESGEDAIQRTYYPNGQQESEHTIVQGLMHGPIQTWFPSGAVGAQGSMHMGRPHGHVRERSIDGTLIVDEAFTFGIPSNKRFQLISLLQGGPFTLLLLVAVAVGISVAMFREGSAMSGLLILALILVIHEFGHWIVGRWVGIPIESFRVGIGPHLCSFVWKQTRFEIHLLPLIGWVKLSAFWPGEWEQYQQFASGEAIPVAPTGHEGVPEVPQPPTPAAKFISPGPRTAFYLGGIAINLLTAFLVLWISTYPTRPDKAATKCAEIAVAIGTTIPMAIKEQLNPKNFVEDQPGLLRGVRDSSRKGVSFAKNFALISIVIAVFNLLPIPPLDGFHVAVTATEKVLGRKVEGRIYNAVLLVGVLFLVLLLITGVFFLGRDLVQMLLGH